MGSGVGLFIPVCVTSTLGQQFSRTLRASRSVGSFVPQRSAGNGRRITVVSRAGPPSTASYVFAFALPMALLIGTIFTAMRVGDKLDQRFLEELEVSEAIRIAEEDDSNSETDRVTEEGENSASVELLKERNSSRQRHRNRPTRKA